jgi:hypothetical protein
VLRDRLVRRRAVVGAVRDESPDLARDLVQQRRDLRRIVPFLIGERVRYDLPRAGIDCQMQLAPAAARLHAVFLLQPLTRAVDLQPGAVDQHVQRTVGQRRDADRRALLRAPAQGRVIGDRQRQPHQLDHRAQQAFGLPQTHPQRTAQHQGGLDRQI